MVIAMEEYVMPQYRLPQFNLLANLWLCSATRLPSFGPADIVDFPCQKYIQAREPIEDSISWWQPNSWVFCQVRAVLRFPRTGPFASTWRTFETVVTEVPAGSEQYYRTFSCDIAHEGFPNEYAMVVASACTVDGYALPPPGASLDSGIGSNNCGD